MASKNGTYKFEVDYLSLLGHHPGQLNFMQFMIAIGIKLNLMI